MILAIPIYVRVFFLKRGKGPGAFEKEKILLRFTKKGENSACFTFYVHITIPSPSSCP